MTRLSAVKDGDWKGFRRVARYYEMSLRRIKGATACSADTLRLFAAQAMTSKKRKSK